MMMKTFLAACLVGIAALAAPAAAQNYPSRNIKFIVPFQAGSATDTLARILGEHVSRTLGRPVIVENMAGASGVLAAQNVARAEPDGHTVLISTNTTHGANQSLLKSVPYDAVNGFEHVTKLGTITLALITNPGVPANDVKELIAYAKANPGKLTFGSGSSSSRIAGEMLKSLGGIDIVHVPYRSNPQAVTDILGGQISLFFADISTTLPQVKAGRVKGFAVSTAQRSKLAPELPTMAEAGVAGYDLAAWFAAFAPAGTPKPVVDKLNAEINKVIERPDVKEAWAKQGAVPMVMSPAEFDKYLRDDIEKWAKVVQQSGIKAN
jgi:tripartite-type tricarboxylate transporter receptor subunit TctC